jgi:hypothetical protein
MCVMVCLRLHLGQAAVRAMGLLPGTGLHEMQAARVITNQW